MHNLFLSLNFFLLLIPVFFLLLIHLIFFDFLLFRYEEMARFFVWHILNPVQLVPSSIEQVHNIHIPFFWQGQGDVLVLVVGGCLDMGDMDILEVLDSTFPDTLLQDWGPLRKTGIMIKTFGADVIPMRQTLEGMRGYMGVEKEVYFLY